jgi:dihydroxyacetone kinase-like predicted kinase
MGVTKTRAPGQGAIKHLEADDFLVALTIFADLLAKHERVINDLNVYPVPDSDTGTNSLTTITAALQSQSLADLGLGDTVHQVAKQASASALGNSGVILAQYLVGLASSLPAKASTQDWALALNAAAVSARAAVLTPEDGTMLSVAQAALIAQPSENFEIYLQQIQRDVRTALINTEEMLPALKLAKVVDAGGVVLTLLHDSFVQAIGVFVTPLEILPRTGSVTDYEGASFEIMFSMSCDLKTKKDLEEILFKLGDSIAISGIEPEFKVHVHSNDPNAVIEASEQLVELLEISITEFGI